MRTLSGNFKQILHWAILQEIKFLESFLLINTRESLKWKDAFNAAIFASHPEHADRDFIINTWVNSISNHPDIKSSPNPNVDETNLPEDMEPEYLATTLIIQSFKKVEEVPSMTDDG
jgi:hypothetical protein